MRGIADDSTSEIVITVKNPHRLIRYIIDMPINDKYTYQYIAYRMINPRFCKLIPFLHVPNWNASGRNDFGNRTVR